MQVGAFTLEPVYDGYGHEAGREVLRIPGVDDPWPDCAHFLGDHRRRRTSIQVPRVISCGRQ